MEKKEINIDDFYNSIMPKEFGYNIFLFDKKLQYVTSEYLNDEYVLFNYMFYYENFIEISDDELIKLYNPTTSKYVYRIGSSLVKYKIEMYYRKEKIKKLKERCSM